MAETERLDRARQQLAALTTTTHEQYQAGRRVLSFDEFLAWYRVGKHSALAGALKY